MDTCGDALILGTKGGLRIPSTECWNGEFTTPLKIYRNICGEPTCYEVPMIKTKNNFFFDKCRAFINEVKKPAGEGKATVPSSEILYNQAIIDAIVKSNELGREVAVEIPEI